MGHVFDAIGNIGTAIGKSPIGKFGHYLGDAVALGTGQGWAIPLIEGAQGAAKTYGSTHNFLDSLKSGALTGGGAYLGGQVGNALLPGLGSFGDKLGMAGSEAGPLAGSFLNSNIGGSVGSGIGNFAGNAISAGLNTGIGQAVGGAVGQSIGSSLSPQKNQTQGNYSTADAPFVPTQQTAINAPNSLSNLSNLSPLQQSTSLANQGVYGGGLGSQESNYFLNLENRRLVNKDNSLNSLSDLTPIENSYLSKMGLGGYGDITSLLKAMSQWKPT